MDNLKWTTITVIGDFEKIILSQLFDLQGFNKLSSHLALSKSPFF